MLFLLQEYPGQKQHGKVEKRETSLEGRTLESCLHKVNFGSGMIVTFFLLLPVLRIDHGLLYTG